jgi:hypothetical protein
MTGRTPGNPGTGATIARRRVRAVSLSGLCVALVLALAPPAPGAVERVGVLTKKNVGEFQPARKSGYLGWEQNSAGNLDHLDVFARRDGGSAIKINPRRTQAAMGGIDGDILVYQQFRGTKKSDIKFFNLKTRRRFSPQIYVNTRKWEYWPDLDGDWVLFGRRNLRGDKRKIILYNRNTQNHRILDVTSSSETFLAPGQVNGNWVVWHRCKPPTKCDVYRYNINLKIAKKVPNVKDRSQYAPSVTPEGIVYFARGRRQCGRAVKFFRWRPGRKPHGLLRLRHNRDVGDSYVATTSAGKTEVFFEQNVCDALARRTNIYKIRFL